jgi:hypothetical protein
MEIMALSGANMFGKNEVLCRKLPNWKKIMTHRTWTW